MILNKLFSIGFRSFPMLLKMILLFFLGNDSLETIGQYGILIATLTILSTFFGLETYNITLKLYISDIKKFKKTYINYFFLSTLIFLLTTSILFLISHKFSFDLKIYFVVVLIAYIEFILNEYYKISVISKPELYINIFYFIKNGMWPISFIIIFYYTSSLEIAFWTYLFVQISILIFIILKHYKSILKYTISSYKIIDFSFLYYLTRAVTLRINQYMDRYSVSYFLDERMTGIVVLMTSLSNFIGQIGDALVVPIYFRKLLSNVNLSLVKNYQIKMFKIGLFWMPVPIVVYFFYNLYKDSELNNFIFEMLIICMVAVINLTAIPFHQSLLSFKSHKKILSIAILNLILSIILINTVLYFKASLLYLNLSILFIAIIMYFIKKRVFLRLLNIK